MTNTKPAIAALFVYLDGAYADVEGVDLWDEVRDARSYGGTDPVVAHPPCSRWCMPLAVVNQTRYGHRVGDDGGCFASALASVRRCGGVLEHPAYSAAFAAHGLPKPGWGWTAAPGGWVCMVAQSQYGHPARKRTWLYYSGAHAPADLVWGDGPYTAIIGRLMRTKSTKPRITKKAANQTPPAFRDALLELARSSTRQASL